MDNGIYVIRSVLDLTAVCDVANGSMAWGANIQLYGDNGTNAQRWKVAIDSAGLATIQSMKSGLYLVCTGTISGKNVVQSKNIVKWYLLEDGSVTINGATVKTYRLHYQSSTGNCMDAAGGSATPKTNVQLWTDNGSDGQLWAFEKASVLDDSLPVPARLWAGPTANGDDWDDKIIANDVTMLYPSWYCDGTEYQVRYRTRERAITDESLGAYSDFKSIADSSTDNHGWGTEEAANCTTENTERKYAPTGITIPAVDGTSIDRLDLQIEVRRFTSADGYPAHGHSAVSTIRCLYKPTLTISNVEWSPVGLSLDYALSSSRNNNVVILKRLTQSGKSLISKRQTRTRLPYSGSILIKPEDLNFVPDEGSSVSIQSQVIMDLDWQYFDYRNTSTISYGGSHGLTVTPTITDGDGYTDAVSVADSDTNDTHVYMLYGDTMTEIEETDGVFYAYPPLNGAAYKLFITQVGTDAWGSVVVERPGKVYKGYVWNWDGNYAAIKWAENNPPSWSNSYSADVSEITTTGRTRPVYSFGKSLKRDLSVSGAFMDCEAYNTRQHFEALASAGLTIFRTPGGGIYRTAIESVKISHSQTYAGKLGDYGSVTVQQMEAGN